MPEIRHCQKSQISLHLVPAYFSSVVPHGHHLHEIILSILDLQPFFFFPYVKKLLKQLKLIRMFIFFKNSDGIS